MKLYIAQLSCQTVWFMLFSTTSRCVICMIDFVIGDSLRYLPCMHIYHRECIDDWMMRSFTCPSCMEPVDAALLTTYQSNWWWMLATTVPDYLNNKASTSCLNCIATCELYHKLCSYSMMTMQCSHSVIHHCSWDTDICGILLLSNIPQDCFCDCVYIHSKFSCHHRD